MWPNYWTLPNLRIISRTMIGYNSVRIFPTSTSNINRYYIFPLVVSHEISVNDHHLYQYQAVVYRELTFSMYSKRRCHLGVISRSRQQIEITIKHVIYVNCRLIFTWKVKITNNYLYLRVIANQKMYANDKHLSSRFTHTPLNSSGR